MQHPISNACASKSSHNHFQHHHDSQNEDESRKGQTSKKGHAKVATKTDYDQSGNRFNNNISCIKKFKDALQMLGISYNDYGSIVTFEDSELKETIKHQLNSAKLFQLLKLFEFLNGNPILVNEYCSNVDAYTGDKFVYSGSVVDKNYKLLKIFSNFLIGFFNEVNFDNYAFRFHFNGRKIYKQIDEVFFNAQLACLKQKDFSRSVSTSSPANLKTSSIFHDRATTIKLNVLLSVYKSFLISATRNETESHIGTSSGIHTGTEGCSASLLQIFIDNCIRIENMILILLNKRPQTEKQKTLKKYKFKTFHKVYRTFHAQYNLNDVKYKHFFWKLTNLASAGSGKPGTNVNTFGTIDNCLYAFRVSILFLLKLLKVLVKIFINSENFQQCTSSTLQTPSPPPQQLLQPSQKQQQQQQQLKSKAIGKGLKTTKKKLMSYFLVYGDHDLLIEFNSIDWNGLLSSKVLDKLV